MIMHTRSALIPALFRMVKWEVAAVIVAISCLGHTAAASTVTDEKESASMEGRVNSQPPEMDILFKAAENGDANAQYKLGEYYYNGINGSKDSAQAVAWYRKAADQGHAIAQNILALCYANGDGVIKDPAKAAEWFRKAAENGHALAQCNLAVAYENGDGVTKDPEKALEWFMKSALQGNAIAQHNLAVRYASGDGVDLDHKQAFYWFNEAAKQGSSYDLLCLATCYEMGRGTEADIVQAIALYRKAAEKGEAMAHASLGMHYLNGNGVLQDDRKACYHILIAGALGLNVPSTSGQINFLRKERLSVAEYNEAQRLANEWIKEFQARSMDGPTKELGFSKTPQEATLSGTGSGFVISPDGYFLTCAHVVENGDTIKVQVGANTYPAKLVRADVHNDVALLKLDGSNFQHLALSLSLPEMGDKVFTVGFPNPELQGASAKYTDGAISSLSGILDDIRTMQITVPIQGGNSGGPLVDAAGNALGLVVAQLNAATVFEYTGTIPQNVNFAIKINYALPLVQSVQDLTSKLLQPRVLTTDSRPVDDVKAAIGLVLVYE